MPVLTPDSVETIARLRKAAGTGGTLSLPDVFAQTIVPRTQFDNVVVDGVTWFIGYGIEHQLFGLVRHLSISHPDRKSLPDLEVIVLLAKEFGFGNLKDNCQISVSLYQKRGVTGHLMQPITQTQVVSNPNTNAFNE